MYPNFDPTRQEMQSHFENHKYTEKNGFFEFDREAAMYWFAYDWHGGQSTNLYSVLSTSPYTPGPFMVGHHDEGDIVDILYRELEAEFSPHD